MLEADGEGKPDYWFCPDQPLHDMDESEPVENISADTSRSFRDF